MNAMKRLIIETYLSNNISKYHLLLRCFDML